MTRCTYNMFWFSCWHCQRTSTFRMHTCEMRAYALHCWIILCSVLWATAENLPFCVCDSSPNWILKIFVLLLPFSHFDMCLQSSCSRQIEIHYFYFQTCSLKCNELSLFLEREKSLSQMKTKQMQLYLKLHFRIISRFVFLYEKKIQHFDEYFIISLTQRYAWACVCITGKNCFFALLAFAFKMCVSIQLIFPSFVRFCALQKAEFFSSKDWQHHLNQLTRSGVYLRKMKYFLAEDKEQKAIHFILWTKK